MKRTIFIYLCALLAFITFYACKPTDNQLQKEVESVLIAYPGVSASVHNGIATLYGNVDSEDMSRGAERVTKAVKHIKSVNNDILVNPSSSYTWDLPVNDDGELINSIQRSLSDGGYNDVHISVSGGEVTLTGKVKRADLQKVMQIANEAPGTVRVINQMEIE